MEMAAGVIAAKARSMLGEQLSAQDYEELLHKRSVAEIAAYLKNGTSYAHALKDVRENNIHRGQLEDLLRRESFRKSMKLYRYSESKQQQYYKLHMQQIEIDLLLSRIRVLISQAYEDAIAEFQKGMVLSKELQKTLESAEKTLVKVMQADGTETEMDA